MDGSVRITATATRNLSAFSLDAGMEKITKVAVAGRPARFRSPARSC